MCAETETSGMTGWNEGGRVSHRMCGCLGICTCSHRKPSQRPPLGVMPRVVWLEHRAYELRACIDRYLCSQECIYRPDLAAQHATELADVLREIANERDARRAPSTPDSPSV